MLQDNNARMLKWAAAGSRELITDKGWGRHLGRSNSGNSTWSNDEIDSIFSFKRELAWSFWEFTWVWLKKIAMWICVGWWISQWDGESESVPAYWSECTLLCMESFGDESGNGITIDDQLVIGSKSQMVFLYSYFPVSMN